MTNEYKCVQIPEGEYLRLVREAQENAEKDYPFTLEELHQLLAYVGASMGGLSNPLYKKLNAMFDETYKRERQG